MSFNKIFAKLGSDYKKPDAVTEFTRENFKRARVAASGSRPAVRRQIDAGSAQKIRHLHHRRRRKGRPKAVKRLFGKAGEQLKYVRKRRRQVARAPCERARGGQKHRQQHHRRARPKRRQRNSRRLYMLSEASHKDCAKRAFAATTCSFPCANITSRPTSAKDAGHRRGGFKKHFRRSLRPFSAPTTRANPSSIGVRVSSLVPLGMSQCSLFEDAARGQKGPKARNDGRFSALQIRWRHH